MLLKNIFGHLHTIHTHRKWVFYYCHLAGITWRGITHDLSKYSPIEFWESVKFWNGTSSPINEAKARYGYSRAWQHHKGRNSHHYEYWADKFDDGTVMLMMPCNDFIELVCDYLGAARAYMGKNFSYSAEYKWWLKKREHCAMHERNKVMLDIIFSDLEKAENPLYIEANTNMVYDFVPSPEKLIKSGYIQEVYNANK